MELIRRYDGPGPRYTSYPTALQFDTAFTEADYRAAAARAHSTAPLSVYVHVPFCESPCFYCGCTKVITRQRGVAEPYVAHLMLEIMQQGALFGGTRAIEQLHFGGGTPTFLSVAQLGRVIDMLSQHFGLVAPEQREFSIEVDPRTVEPATLFELAALGFNRISLGVQDFDPRVQTAVNRVQPVGATLALIEAARRAGFRSVSVDLIYGLPLQTAASFERTLQQVLSVRPDRVAAYSYAHLPERFKPQQRIRQEDLPTPATKLQLLELTIGTLAAAGYVYIGMDHFARPGDELVAALYDGSLQRNFQGYSTRGGLDLIGLGMSSIGRIDDCYAQNRRTLDGYASSIESGHLAVDRGLRLTAEDRLRREVIEAIMCGGIVDTVAIGAAHGVDFRRHFAAELRRLQPLANDGLVELDDRRIVVTPVGRYLLRAIAMCFDAYLPAAQPTATAARASYSRIV